MQHTGKLEASHKHLFGHMSFVKVTLHWADVNTKC